MKAIKKLLLMLSAFALVFSITACGDQTPAGGGTPAVPPPAPTGDLTPTNNGEDVVLESLDGMTIAAFVVIEDQFQRMLQESMAATFESFGANVIVGNANSQLDQEVVNIHNAVAAGADGIAIFPVDAVGSVAALREAADQGVSIFGINVNLGDDLQVGWAESDQYGKGVQVGEIAREFLLENFDEFPLRMAVMQFHGLNTTMSDQRTNGFLSQVYDLVEIIATDDDWIASTAINTAADRLNATPDIDVWWWANEGAAVGSVMAQRNAGVTIPGFTIAMSEQIADMLLDDDGRLIAANGQDPSLLGHSAAYNLSMALMGRDHETYIQTPGILLTAGDEEGINAWLEEWRAGM